MLPALFIPTRRYVFLCQLSSFPSFRRQYPATAAVPCHIIAGFAEPPFVFGAACMRVRAGVRVCGCRILHVCLLLPPPLFLPFSSFVSFLFLSLFSSSLTQQHLELLYSLRPSPVPVAASNGPNGVRRSSVLFQDGLNPFKRESSHHLSF